MAHSVLNTPMKSIFDSSPLFLYSETQLPPSGITQCSIDLNWFGDDTEARYKDRPHPLLASTDISYRFNAKGYRCADFDTTPTDAKTLSVVSIGASEVFGIGLPVEYTFPQVFCDMLSQKYGCNTLNWNLGISGSSADYISRVLFSALPVLKPDIVLIVFPPLLRREYVNDTDRVFIFTDRLGSYSLGKRILHRLYDPENSRQSAAHRTLSSEPADQINSFKNYQLCEAMCTKHDVMWLCSPFADHQLEHTRHLFDSDHLVLPAIYDLRNRCMADEESIDYSLARDLGHPGIKPNQDMAEMFFQRLQQLYPSRLPSPS